MTKPVYLNLNDNSREAHELDMMHISIGASLQRLPLGSNVQYVHILSSNPLKSYINYTIIIST